MLLKRIISVMIAGFICSAPLLSNLSAGAEGETVLSQGKSYTLEYEGEIDGAFPGKAYEPESSLTDGVTASNAAYADPAFLHLYRGTAVHVTIDLESVCAVSSVELSALQGSGGVCCPRYVKVAVSEDGESFGTVGSVSDPDSIASKQTKIVKYNVKLDKTYRARYVRVTFSSDVHTYVDEISVYGSADAAGAASAEADAPFEERGFGPQIDGIGNIVLMYTVGKYTEEQLLPYLMYVDTDGNTTDTMFDSMLFLPSGASNYDYTKATGWDTYLTEMLGVGTNTNLEALNTLVGKHKEELGGKKYPVFLSVPFLALSNVSIDGITPNTLEGRSQFLQKFIDKMVDQFNAAGFEHLELKGLYWHEELIQYTMSTHEEDLMVWFNDYAHGKGLKTIWIPYFGSPGLERAVELGFDCATLQSGYAFSRTAETAAEIGYATAKSVEDSAALAKKYGLGMEFELDLGPSDHLDRYFKYVHTGYSTGCMNGHMMMLYQSVHGIYGCAGAAAGSNQRQIYEMTYRYIKQTFTSYAPVIAENQVIAAKIGARSSGKLEVTDADSVRGTLKTAETTIPEGLPFVVEGDGFYVLNASDCQPGLYEVTFTVTDTYNLSEPGTVKILLYDPEDPGIPLELTEELTVYARLDASSAETTIPVGTATAREVENGWYYVSAEVNGKTVDGFAEAAAIGLGDEGSSGGGLPGWAIGVIAGGAALLVVAAAAAAFLLKKKKN